jgi:Kef-type K+ transport system membrane component KefB
VDSTSASSLTVIVLVAVLAPLLAELLRRFRIPGVVLELGFGILIGQQVLGLAEETDIIDALGNLGLSFLMFLAGFDIDLERLRGRTLSRASTTWLISLALGLVVAGVMVLEGFAISDLLVGLALTTTALGTLLPMLRDADVLDSPFGGHVLAAGTLGEFGPIVAIAVLLTSDNPAGTILLLLVFVALALATVWVATRARSPRVVALMQKHLQSSAQLPVRVAVLLVVLLVWVAAHLGLDVLLGAFTAGIVVRLFTEGPDEPVISGKLEAIGFGFLIPVFFVVSGMSFDLDALVDPPTTLLRVPLFLALFFVVRGVPTLFTYRRDLPGSERTSLAFFSATALPLVVVITGIGLDTERMHPQNAAALVGAAMVSVLLYPLIAFALHRRSRAEEEAAQAP